MSNAFPDEEAAEDANRDELARPGIQHEADDKYPRNRSAGYDDEDIGRQAMKNAYIS
jgi:hypothetical protein